MARKNGVVPTRLVGSYYSAKRTSNSVLFTHSGHVRRVPARPLCAGATGKHFGNLDNRSIPLDQRGVGFQLARWPGSNLKLIVAVPSLNGGKNSPPIHGNVKQLSSTSMLTTPSTILVDSESHRSIRSSTDLSQRHESGSRLSARKRRVGQKHACQDRCKGQRTASEHSNMRQCKQSPVARKQTTSSPTS